MSAPPGPPPPSLPAPVAAGSSSSPSQLPPRLRWPAADDSPGGEAWWHSSRGDAPPAEVRSVDDRTPANVAYRLAETGCALRWHGDFGNARHLLQALARRVDRPPRSGPAAADRSTGTEADGRDAVSSAAPSAPLADAFLAERRRQARRATLLGRLTIVLAPDYAIELPRAPDWRLACTQAWGPPLDGDATPHAAPLTELLGAASAAEWRRVGVEVPELGPPPGNRIHPHHGVFSPVRGEYLSLVAALPLPRPPPPLRSPSHGSGSRGGDGGGGSSSGGDGGGSSSGGDGGGSSSGGDGGGSSGTRAVGSGIDRGGASRRAADTPGDRDPSRLTAFDIGTGTGVLAVLLARRGVGRVVATDLEPRAVACARDNVARLGLDDRIVVERRDGFPDGRADLVVCNPPWLPVDATTPLERAVYDPGGAMLAAFLAALPAHLAPGGEAWLVMSDLAERLGLRDADALPRAFAAAGLTVRGRHGTRPRHPRARDAGDPLHAARAAEVTSLWRLGVR